MITRICVLLNYVLLNAIRMFRDACTPHGDCRFGSRLLEKFFINGCLILVIHDSREFHDMPGLLNLLYIVVMTMRAPKCCIASCFPTIVTFFLYV